MSHETTVASFGLACETDRGQQYEIWNLAGRFNNCVMTVKSDHDPRGCAACSGTAVEWEASMHSSPTDIPRTEKRPRKDYYVEEHRDQWYDTNPITGVFYET